jgi:hypothetical protein
MFYAHNTLRLHSVEYHKRGKVWVCKQKMNAKRTIRNEL